MGRGVKRPEEEQLGVFGQRGWSYSLLLMGSGGEALTSAPC